MFACTLKTRPEKGASTGRAPPPSISRACGAGARSTIASRSSRTPMLETAAPKKTGVDVAPRNDSASNSAPSACSSWSSSVACSQRSPSSVAACSAGISSSSAWWAPPGVRV